jgi:hypothetical protein
LNTLASVFVAAVTFLPSHYLTTIEGYTYAQSSESDLGRCDVEMGQGAMIYIPSFTKIGSGIQKLMGKGHTDTDSKVNT